MPLVGHRADTRPQWKEVWNLGLLAHSRNVDGRGDLVSHCERGFESCSVQDKDTGKILKRQNLDTTSHAELDRHDHDTLTMEQCSD